MNLAKAYGMLGLAAKAGKVASGEFSVEKAVKEHRARLVIVAADASRNTQKMFRDMCAYYKVPIYICSEKERLGQAVGRQQRASLAVTEEGLAKSVERLLQQDMDDGGSENGEGSK